MVRYGVCNKAVYTDDMEHIPADVLEALECGDVVIKETVEDGKLLRHLYHVTHKQATGICISYNTTGYSDTYSYDKVDGVWTFNSKDVWQAQ